MALSDNQSRKIFTMDKSSSDDEMSHSTSSRTPKKQKTAPVANECEQYYLENPGERQIQVLLAMCLGCKPEDPMFADCDVDPFYKSAKNKQAFKPSCTILQEEIVR